VSGRVTELIGKELVGRLHMLGEFFSRLVDAAGGIVCAQL